MDQLTVCLARATGWPAPPSPAASPPPLTWPSTLPPSASAGGRPRAYGAAGSNGNTVDALTARRAGDGSAGIPSLNAGALMAGMHEGRAVPPPGHATPRPGLLDAAVRGWAAAPGGGRDDPTRLRIAPAEPARVTRVTWIACLARPCAPSPSGDGASSAT